MSGKLYIERLNDLTNEDDKENETIGYQQIVIFDYETRSK